MEAWKHGILCGTSQRAVPTVGRGRAFSVRGDHGISQAEWWKWVEDQQLSGQTVAASRQEFCTGLEMGGVVVSTSNAGPDILNSAVH